MTEAKSSAESDNMYVGVHVYGRSNVCLGTNTLFFEQDDIYSELCDYTNKTTVCMRPTKFFFEYSFFLTLESAYLSPLILPYFVKLVQLYITQFDKAGARK